MRKSIILFVMTTALSIGMILYGCIFTGSRISEVTLTEETIAGDRKATEGLTAGFRTDAGDDIHWINTFDYSSGKTKSVFKRGEMLEAAETSIYDDIQRDKTFGKGDLTKTVKTLLYDDIRFTGWFTEPFVTRLNYDELEGLQEKEIHEFYDNTQKSVADSGEEEIGRIRLKDYLDYYPVSFKFRLGANLYDSGNALTGLKIYDEQGQLSAETGAAYDEDVALYTAFNTMFRIPVIDNEYQEYKISVVEEHDPKTALGYEVKIKKPLGAGEDYYEFDPIMALQEEPVDVGKNRMLFIVNNRTAKGVSVDVSGISGGYGVYELPIEVDTKAERIGHRIVTVSAPVPLPDRMKMVYPLDETAEYVEMSLSGDHRHLAVFSVKKGRYFLDMVDTDAWTSKGAMEIFPASDEMTYAWGEDGSLAVTNHRDSVAVFCRNSQEPLSYQLIYSGKAGKDFCEAFFDSKMIDKKHSCAKYQYGIDKGLAIAAGDGKIALVQNQLVRFDNTDVKDDSIRNASLECAIIDETGVTYWGRLNSDIVDIDYDMNSVECRETENLLSDAPNAKAMNRMIQPVRKENRAEW